MPYQDTPPQRSRPTFEPRTRVNLSPGTDPRLRRPNTATMPWATPTPPRQLPSDTFVGPHSGLRNMPSPGLLPPSTAPPPSTFDAEQTIREANKQGRPPETFMSPMNPGNPFPGFQVSPSGPRLPGGPELPGGPTPPIFGTPWQKMKREQLSPREEEFYRVHFPEPRVSW